MNDTHLILIQYNRATSSISNEAIRWPADAIWATVNTYTQIGHGYFAVITGIMMSIIRHVSIFSINSSSSWSNALNFSTWKCRLITFQAWSMEGQTAQLWHLTNLSTKKKTVFFYQASSSGSSYLLTRARIVLLTTRTQKLFTDVHSTRQYSTLCTVYNSVWKIVRGVLKYSE